nr:MAG TPA: hypothetical protein [Caudoviricetes sp.]
MSNAMHKIKKPPIKGRRLPMKAILKTNIIITQKKPQHNAEASTTTAMISLLQCEGR